MTWIDDNKRPLMAVGAILGVAWFGGRYFDKNQSFGAERIQYNYTVHREPKGSSKGGWFKSKKAETFEANDICHRSCYDGHEWRLSGTSHLGEYTTDGKPILNWRCDSCGQSKSSPTEPKSKADTHDWEMTKTKNWGDGVFTIYAECKRCGVKGYADGDVEESIDIQHPSLRAETFEAEQCKHEDYYVIGMDGDEWNEGGENFAMLEIECESCGVRGKGETNLSYDTAPNREHNSIWWEDIGFEAETFEAEKRDGRDMTLDEIEETYGEGRLCFLCFDGVMERGEMGFGRDATGTIYTCSNCGAREGMGLNAESFEIDYFDLKAKLNRRIIDERFDIAGEEGRFYLTEHDNSEIDDAYFLILLDKTSLENARKKEVEIKNAVNNVLVFYGFSDYSFETLDEGFNGTDVIISKGQRQYAETFEAKGDCAECYGTGGLYDSHMGINDECHSCGGTGFDY